MKVYVNVNTNDSNKSCNKPVSRLCDGIVSIDKNNEFQVEVADNDGTTYILSLTKESLEISGKQSIYSRKKDETNHYVRKIRDGFQRITDTPSTNDWATVCNNLIVTGYIVKNNNEYEFDLVNTHGINKMYYNVDVKIDYEKPLFKK